MLAEETPQAIDTLIEEVQSTHQGAFSNLWEQPAIRALISIQRNRHRDPASISAF